ncbi:dihydrolipoyl dehydrogenase [Rhodospirillaceae bacterium KN72]|uniref:Dihydrolipoyl dehydrogenase n=1 Tax=Pacificispira spongiicola TaxID=2729598 RepID=A0A7Y0DWQ2_9PROT|nr:dihydrolipoyl dehydrogenase [Pacificispira spongiicola]NMM43007.1 dihydrolipoyl dehydrogenase [Pacificispira spongiicola]
MSETYDVVVIGGGPGGYVAAIRAAQLGMKTACVEMRGKLGGTCLNVGCIPSKALLQSSELYHEAQHSFASHGIVVSPKLDLKAMLDRKAKIVEGLTGGIEFLFKKNKIDYVKGRGHIDAPGQVSVTEGDDKGKVLTTKNIVIATGSESTPLPGLDVDEKTIVTSTGALEFDKVPKHLAVIGGGVIGLELGSVWKRLGAQVTVIEFLDRIVPNMDGEVSKTFQRTLKKQGLEFKLKTKVTGAKKSKSGVELTMEPAAGGDVETLSVDKVLVCIGRRPYTEGLGLDDIGVERDKRGVIQVDAHYKTNIDGIYAIGDCIPGPMLAHKAEDEGVVIAEILAGQKPHINYDAIPGVVYTWPEVADVGMSEEKLKEQGRAYKVGKFPFMANSRAKANDATDGFVKILADAETDRVLGAHIIGPAAGEMIHEIVTIIEFGGSSEDVARTCHAHPTFSEAVKEAALDVEKRAIHV